MNSSDKLGVVIASLASLIILALLFALFKNGYDTKQLYAATIDKQMSCRAQLKGSTVENIIKVCGSIPTWEEFNNGK
jgi:hypothetical protein